MRAQTERLTVWLATGLLAFGRAFGRVAGKLLLGLLLLAAWPLEWLWRQTTQRLTDAIDARLEVLREQRELRRLWCDEFRGEFATFAEFEAAFNGGGASQDAAQDEDNHAEPEPPPADPSADPFAEACRLFDLPPDGTFTRQELTARYRRLMQKAHPEHGGSHEHAAQLNAARDFIKRRKGWT